jgi:hypothetical protein
MSRKKRINVIRLFFMQKNDKNGYYPTFLEITKDQEISKDRRAKGRG